MKIEELYEKYGKELMDKIISGDYLAGNTVVIDDNREIVDIPEDDIILAIRQMNGEPINHLNWD